MEFEKLCEIIASALGVDKNEITRETTFAYDLGADSIDMAQIAFDAQCEFDIDVHENMLKKIVTVGDAENLIKGYTK